MSAFDLFSLPAVPERRMGGLVRSHALATGSVESCLPEDAEEPALPDPGQAGPGQSGTAREKDEGR